MSTGIENPLVNLIEKSFLETGKTNYFYKGQDTSLKYGQLWDQVCKTRGLLRRIGVFQGDRALIVSREKHVVAVLYIAALLEGIAAVILDPDGSDSEINVLAERSNPAVIFIDSSKFVQAKRVRKEESIKVIEIDASVRKSKYSALFISKDKKNSLKKNYPAMLDFESGISEFLDLPLDTVGLILFTSGTTAKPKGVVHTHGSLSAQMIAFIRHFELSGGEIIANHLPLHHSDGLNQGVLLTLIAKSQWLVPPSPNMQNISSVLDLLYRERVTHFITVPAVLKMIERTPKEFDDSFSSAEFKFIESTAGPLDKDLWEQIENRFGVKIVNCYGLTETVCESIYCGPDEAYRRVGSVGKPVQGDIKIVDPSGCEVGSGESGELCIRSPAMMQGYLDDPDATNAVLKNGWFHTGDLARLDEDGFVYIVGRIKNIIIRGGVNIIPEEIAEVLKTIDGVDEAVVIGLPDDFLGEKVVACIYSHSNQFLEIDDLFEQCRELMAREKIPNNIIQVKNLPLGPSGKVDLPALKQQVRDIEHNKDAAFSELGEGVSSRVMQLSASVFRVPVERVSINSSPDNMREWDSLAFLELLMAVEREFQIKLKASDVIKISSLADIVGLLEESVNAEGVEL
ncbi:AMP-binding protein [Microbulbifer sp. JMSA003]|uniref:AMP-binding protein n=1 Tax=Microbulbifer sp. JMSA003 TaxID=3243369 RepID=UPI004039F792